MRTILLVCVLAIALSPATAAFAQTASLVAFTELTPPTATPGMAGWSMAPARLAETPSPEILLVSSSIGAQTLPLCSVAPLPENENVDAPLRCIRTPEAYQRFLTSTTPVPLTPTEKGYLAVHDFVDPGNLATIANTSAFTIGMNSHTAYGPGWRGFGRNVGDSLLQDATGEFFSTFLIASLAREDPHYYRMPHASIPRRILHAISRTIIAQSDRGTPIPNFDTLLTYPISAEIANLYVPGVHGNGPSTVARIMTGYATDPIDNLITEFLPDVARRIHIRVIFVQRILNQVSSDQYALP
jgi:hypothetical protein